MISKPYIDRSNQIPTWDADPDDSTFLKIDTTARGWTGPISVVAQTPVVDAGRSLAISNVSITTTELIFKHTGAGGTVTFRITRGSPSETEDLTIRIKAV